MSLPLTLWFSLGVNLIILIVVQTNSDVIGENVLGVWLGVTEIHNLSEPVKLKFKNTNQVRRFLTEVYHNIKWTVRTKHTAHFYFSNFTCVFADWKWSLCLLASWWKDGRSVFSVIILIWIWFYIDMLWCIRVSLFQVTGVAKAVALAYRMMNLCAVVIISAFLPCSL